MSVQELPPKSCHDLREADPTIPLLDVRTPEEFAAGHPAGAVNVPVFFRTPAGMQPNDSFLAAAERVAPAKDRRVILSCQSGRRSLHAAELLRQAGYAHPINLRAGFGGVRAPDGAVLEPGWADAGLPVTTDPGDRSWEAVRQGL